LGAALAVGPAKPVAAPDSKAPRMRSSRRFEGRCSPAIVLGWARIRLLYWLRASPERLALL
jgi:hypothetical protein